MALIEIKHLKKSFSKKVILDDINLSIEKGDIVGIIGLSGEGKSTLLRMINGLETLDDGEIYLHDELLASKNKKISKEEKRKIGMIFQNFNLLEQRDVLSNVELGLEFAKDPKKEEKALEAIKKVGLEDKIHFYPSQLSGGQKQRVAIARVLALNPDVILSDEATSALDPETTVSILDLLKSLNKQYGITIIMVSHQLESIESICNKVCVLSHTHIVEEGKIGQVFLKPQSEITKSLIYAKHAKTDLDDNKMIRLIFDGNSDEPVVAQIIQRCQILVSIIYADTRIIKGKKYGQMLIKAPKHDEDLAKLKQFLEFEEIKYEEVN